MSKRPAEGDGIEPEEKQPRLEEEEETIISTELTESVVVETEPVEEQVNTETVEEQVNTETVEEQVNTETVEEHVTTETVEEQVNTETVEEQVNTETVEEQVHVETVDEQLTTVGEVQEVDEVGEVMPQEGTVVTGEDGLQYTITEIPADEDQKVSEDDVPVETVIDAGLVQNIIVQHMDIAEPLQTLRKLLESRLQCALGDHEFFLQDSLQLDPDKNLVEQCVQGEGMVQINVEVTSTPGTRPKINIVDILKPAEEIIEAPVMQQVVPQPAPTKVVIPFPDETEHVTRWIVDQSFRKEQERLKIPFDPSLWNEAHVKHWIQWAIKEFTLEGVLVESFNFTGRQLCELQHPDFSKLIPFDRGDVFWTHLELLRKCKFVATIQPSTPLAITTVTVSTSGDQAGILRTPRLGKMRSPRIMGEPGGTPGNRTGNNGQIQLWQFLLELLTDKDCREIISWVGDNGEFKLNNPEMVARLWGERKNKPTMNYEKLSRALRYYYDGDMIAKVHGKRFVYKFVCDLRGLLGYNAAELNQLVSESAEKKLQKVRETLRPGIIRKVPVLEKTTYMTVPVEKAS